MAKAHPLDPEFAPDPAYPAIFRPRPPILSDDLKGFLIIVCGAITVLAILLAAALYSAWLGHQRDLAAIRAGLVQGEIAGRDGVYWVRPDGGRPDDQVKGE